MSEEIFVRRASGLVRELEWYDVAIWALATPAAIWHDVLLSKAARSEYGEGVLRGYIIELTREGIKNYWRVEG